MTKFAVRRNLSNHYYRLGEMGKPWNPETSPNLSGKVSIVTGSNVGLGLETAKRLAEKGATVILACRSEQRAQKALHEIESELPSTKGRVHFIQLDLCSQASVKSFAETFKSKWEMGQGTGTHGPKSDTSSKMTDRFHCAVVSK